MCNIHIVPTTEEHIDDIMIVEKLSFSIPWSREAFADEIGRNKFAVYFSAVLEDKVIGYGGMWSVLDEGHITNIAIHPQYRGKGVSHLIMKALIHTAKERGMARMTLEVRKSNTVARALYTKYGFEPCGIRRGYYGDNGEDAIIMWKHKI